MGGRTELRRRKEGRKEVKEGKEIPCIWVANEPWRTNERLPCGDIEMKISPIREYTGHTGYSDTVENWESVAVSDKLLHVTL